MHLIDRDGVSLSTRHGFARDAYDRALAQFHCYGGDPVAEIDHALEAHPEFVMGLALKAGVLLTATDRSLDALVDETLSLATRHAGTAGARAQGHLAALLAWRSGDWQRAVGVYGKVLEDFPRDTLALQIAHIGDHLLGDATALRERPARALSRLAYDAPSRPSVLGMHAFGLVESGEYDAAESCGREAVRLNPGDVWAIHAVAHVCETQGRLDDGVNWLERRRADWLPDNSLAFHNAWHLALYWLDADRFDKALQIYDEWIRPADSDVVLELIDASALLWRLHLRNVDVGARWRPLLDRWRRRIGDRVSAFNDLHALFAMIACRDMHQARQLVMDLVASARGDGRHAAPAQTAGVNIARGLLWHAEGRHEDALPLLVLGLSQSAALGGSHAQRDIVALTALDCARQANAPAIEMELLHRRLIARPNSPIVWSAIGNWRARNENEATARSAYEQSEHARREWKRKMSSAETFARREAMKLSGVEAGRAARSLSSAKA